MTNCDVTAARYKLYIKCSFLSAMHHKNYQFKMCTKATHEIHISGSVVQMWYTYRIGIEH